MDQAPVLQFTKIVKDFPGVKALNQVSFGVRAGSVHALVGENGAGKSTLLKILSGVYRPTAGWLSLDGKECRLRSAAEGLKRGIGVIYQELHLVPELSVAENLYLGHMPGRYGMLDRRKLNALAERQLATLDEAIEPNTKLADLSLAQRQMVEIAKALTRGARIIAFDEPTSSLSNREVEKLFSVILDLKRRGHAIVYVSHRLEEIFTLCDAATVLRDGKHVKTYETLVGLTPDQLVTAMVGRDISDVYAYVGRGHGRAVLAVERLTGPGLAAPASLQVARGEIVGVFGLVGAGRSELLKLIYGAVTKHDGTVQVDGENLVMDKPADAIRAGVALCPEDRQKEGVIACRSVMENLNLSARRKYARLGFFLKRKWEKTNAQQQVERLDIRTPSLAQTIVHLSGGNQQKVILGRWLAEELKVLLLDEPTRGIDVGAKSEIYAIIYSLVHQGTGVLMVSSELPEVLGIADRVLVMRQGCIVADLARADADAEQVLRLALPVQEELCG